MSWKDVTLQPVVGFLLSDTVPLAVSLDLKD